MSGMFGSSSSAAQPEVYAGIQVSTSQYGQPIPYVAGRQKIPFTLMQYGNFVATGNSPGGKGGGGNGTKSYTYSTSFVAALCLGPIVGVFTVYHDKSLTTLANENLALSEGGAGFTGSISGTTLTASGVIGFIQVGAALTNAAVAPGTTITGLGTGTGGAGTYTVSISQSVSARVMSSSQNVFTGYPANTPTIQKIPYDHIAYVATGLYNLGSSASMPNLQFEVEGSLPGFSDAHGMLDADPSAVIIQYLTDPSIGAGFQGTIQNLVGATNTYQAYVMSLGLLISPYENTQRAATDFIKEVLQITNSDMFLSVGQMRVQPLTDQPVGATTPDGSVWSYTPNLTPQFIFNDDHYIPQAGDPPVKLTRRALNDTHNMVNLEYVDRTNYYNTAPVNASINSDIAKYGPRLMSGLTFHQITNAQTAKMAAQLILQADLYERNTYEFRTRQDFCQVEPLDYVALNDSGLGLVNQVCRVLEVSDGPQDVLTFKVLEMPGVTRSAPQYNWNAAAGYAANYATAPGSIQAPAIFTMPPIPAALSDGIAVGIAVAPTAAQAFWAGCHAWMSVDGGNTYALVGLITSPARYGTLSALIAAGSADPDVTNTLAIDLNNNNLQVSTAVTHAEADSMQTLMLVGSGATAEVMSFGAASLVSAGNYNLTYLRRGVYGSGNQGHSSGAPFVRLDGDIFTVSVDPGYAGQPLFFKFTSFNLWQQAEEAIASVTAYSYTVPSAIPIAGAVSFIPRGNAAFSDPNVYKNAGAASAWDSDCVSSSASDALTVTATYSAGSDMTFGLSPNISATLNPNTTSGAGSFDFCFNIVAGTWKIFESGVSAQTLVAAVPGDTARITYDRYTVRYYLNGVLQRQVQKVGALEFIGLTLFEASDVWSQVLAGFNTIATPNPFVASGNALTHDSTAVKIGGSNAWDSALVSINAYKQCHVQGKLSSVAPTSNDIFIGLTTNPQGLAALTSNNYVDIDYGWHLNGSATTWEIWESGTAVLSSIATAATTDLVAITYDGATITYLLNGAVIRTVSIASLTLFAGLAFYYPTGAGVNSISFGPGIVLDTIPEASIDSNAVSTIASSNSSANVTSTPAINTTGNDTVISITVNTTGAPIEVDAGCSAQISSTTGGTMSVCELRIFRDGSAVSGMTWDATNGGLLINLSQATQPQSQQVTLVVTDAPAAGSHTYSMVMTTHFQNSGSGVAHLNCFNNFIKVREIKK